MRGAPPDLYPELLPMQVPVSDKQSNDNRAPHLAEIACGVLKFNKIVIECLSLLHSSQMHPFWLPR